MNTRKPRTANDHDGIASSASESAAGWRMIRMLLLLVALGVALAWAPPPGGSTGAPGGPQRPDPVHPDGSGDDYESAANRALSLSACTIQSLQLPADAQTNLLTTLNLDDVLYTLSLEPYSIRSPDFYVFIQKNGLLVEQVAPPSFTMRGELLESPHNVAAGSVRNGQMTVQVILGDSRWAIQPLSTVIHGADPSLHVVFNERDLIDTGDHWCGNSEVGSPDAGQPTGGNMVPPHAGGPTLPYDGGEGPPAPGDDDGGVGTQDTGLKVTDIGCDADFEFYQDDNSSVSDTVFDIEDIINRVEAIYENDVQIAYEVTTIVVRTEEPDPYTSTNSGTLLDQFASKWNTTPESFIQRDVGHLFTGKELDGNIIGIANLGVICNTSSAYALSQSHYTMNITNRTALTAHETGHNWNAVHCDGAPDGCNIMCSVLGGCSGILTEFEPMGIAAINSFKASRTCLSSLASPIYPPFYEDFPTTTLDTAKWSYNKGGTIVIGALNEPSAPNSLNLDADGPADFRDDDIRSNFISLFGKSNLTLSYFTERRNVESGKELFVEYWNNNTTWVQINHIISDGVTQDNFESWSHVLPADAYHNEFRVRFRTAVANEGDDWFIDDVRVGDGATGQIWMSFKTILTVPGITGNVQNEDIVAFDLVTGKWSMMFDGSDVGLGPLAIGGLAVLPDGDMLLSFTNPGVIPGMTGGPDGENLDDSDIVRFHPTQLGGTTAGSFVFYFDGSDVGLTDDIEDIDGITLNDQGQLLLSFTGAATVPGVSDVQDEDLLRFAHTSLGSDTAGTWSMRFDGSDVGLADTQSEDVDAVSRRPGGGLGFLLSTNNAFTVQGLSGTGLDCVEFAATQLGPVTAGSFSMRLPLGSMGIDQTENIGGMEYVP